MWTIVWWIKMVKKQLYLQPNSPSTSSERTATPHVSALNWKSGEVYDFSSSVFRSVWSTAPHLLTILCHGCSYPSHGIHGEKLNVVDLTKEVVNLIISLCLILFISRFSSGDTLSGSSATLKLVTPCPSWSNISGGSPWMQALVSSLSPEAVVAQWLSLWFND